MKGLKGFERIEQIDCNNPHIDHCVATRFSSLDERLAMTFAGKEISADESDEVPYGCPLTHKADDVERCIVDFVTACGDCPHSFISLLLE